MSKILDTPVDVYYFLHHVKYISHFVRIGRRHEHVL